MSLQVLISSQKANFLLFICSYYNIFHVNGHVLSKFKQGYIIGNGLTVPNIDYNARIPYAHRMALISDEYFKVILFIQYFDDKMKHFASYSHVIT